jgi:hypothetical protein
MNNLLISRKNDALYKVKFSQVESLSEVKFILGQMMLSQVDALY